MPTLRASSGRTRGVKDNGWLIRNAIKINSIKVKTYSSGKAFLYAYLNSGDTFSSVFDSQAYCLEWLCTRRGMRGIKVTFAATDFVIGQAVRVTDADGKPYHLIACECDNTHQQNKTVCRWCFAKGASPDSTTPPDLSNFTRTARSRGKRRTHGKNSRRSH